MIELYDRYSQESRDLHESLVATGFSQFGVVIDADGFLPDGLVSPFTYYLGYEKGKPLYFNQVPVPDFWEILGDNQSARIEDVTQERAVIHYADGLQARLVKQVDWKDLEGRVRQVDHYNRFGACFATTTYSADSEPIMTVYQDLGFDNHQLIFNTLATPFLVSFHHPDKSGSDVLVWQEPLYDAIPGNMQLILESHDVRTKKIIIPNKATYERALELTDEKYHAQFVHLGYHYQFKRDNFLRRDALILTNSDQIEQVEAIIEALPDVTFRIAAVTEMSSKLLDLLRYPNVVLYQNASLQKIQELYQLSDIYLDINHHNELLQAVRQAFEHNVLILGFNQTVHNRFYIAPDNLFESSDVPALVDAIKLALSDISQMSQALGKQGQQANYIDLVRYQETMQAVLGG